MKLIYIWLEKYNCLEEFSLGFSSEYIFRFRKESEMDILEISKRETDLCNFFNFLEKEKNTKIDFFGIVGENGIGKTTITNYIYYDIFSEGRRIYAFYDDIHSKIIVDIYESAGENGKRKLDIKNETDLIVDINYISAGDLNNLFISRNIYKGYFSNALNYIADYQRSYKNENDYSKTNNILKSKFDLKSYYSTEFAKEIAFFEGKEKLNISNRFSLFLPKKVKIAVPKYAERDLVSNNRYFNRYALVKKYNNEMKSACKDQDPVNRVAIILILSIQKKFLWNKEKRSEEIRILTKEIFAKVCESVRKNKGDKWKSYLTKVFNAFRKQKIEDDDCRIFLESCENLFEKICDLGIIQDGDICLKSEQIIVKEGIFDLNNRIEKVLGIPCVQFDWALSSGEKAILNLLANLKAFSTKIQNWAKNMDILLIIDELDLYLHPTLQQDILSILKEYVKDFFREKSITIIFTTHSPLVLSDMPREKLAFLRKNGDNKICLYDKLEDYKTFGTNITSLYYNSFGMGNGSMGIYASTVIKEIVKELQKDEEHLSEQRYNEINNMISCIGDVVIRNKLVEMLEKRKPKKSILKDYYEKQIKFYTKRIEELELADDKD